MIVIIFRNMKYCVFGLYSKHEFLIYSFVNSKLLIILLANLGNLEVD